MKCTKEIRENEISYLRIEINEKSINIESKINESRFIHELCEIILFPIFVNDRFESFNQKSIEKSSILFAQ